MQPDVELVIALVEQLNVPVFPCKPDAKQPLTRHGFKDATRDVEHIRAWSAAEPAANWGMPTGADSGFVVLDVDLHDGKDGEATLEALEKEYGRLPDTPTVLTPSGGRHLWFRANGHAIGSGTDKLGVGLDVKGSGGYVVIPPSAIFDRTYQWEASSDPAAVPFAALPAWLIDLLAKPAARDHTGDWLVNISAGIALHDSLRDLAAHWAAIGMGGDEIQSRLEELLEQSSAARDQRWADRLAEIPALIDSAIAKFQPVELRYIDKRDLATLIGMPSGTVAQPLDRVYDFIRRFVAYPSDDACVAHVLWIAHTHLMSCFESTPRLALLSPEPGSGKTRGLEITAILVPNPLEAINASAAYIFRKVSDRAGLPTILFDEIDTIFGPRAKEHEELRAILNAGHRRGAMAGRCVIRGKGVETEEFPAFCAVAMAGLGNLPDTIISRSIVIRMRRRSPTEQVEPYRHRVHAREGNELRSELAAWAQTITAQLTDAWPAMPPGIEDRNADVWEALLAIADAAGGGWPGRARAAALAHVAAAQAASPSLGVRLLSDLQVVFGNRDVMSTESILIDLQKLEESPWRDIRGKALDPRRLANFLKPYGISSKTVRIGDSTPKGYSKESLWDAWVRYLGTPDRNTTTSATATTLPEEFPF